MLIYVLSRFKKSYSTSRLKEAAQGVGHQVKLINHDYCEFQIGEKPIIYYKGETLPNPDFIIPRIGASTAFHGTNLVRQYEIMGIKTTGTANGLLNSRDKFRALQLLAQENIPIPKSYFTPNKCQWKNIVNTVGEPPFVIKLLEGTQGLGVSLPLTKFNAKELIESYQRLGNKFLIQEYIEESKGTDIRAFVVGNKVVASMQRVAHGDEFRSNIHRGGIGKKISLTPEEESIAIKAVKIMGLNLGGVDILRSKKGPLVLEVNSSPGLEGIEKYSGIPVADEIIKYLETQL